MTAGDILDLAGRVDGYMVPFNAEVLELRDAGLIITTYACEGFVIARAVQQPQQRRAPYGWRGSRDALTRRYLAARGTDHQPPKDEGANG